MGIFENSTAHSKVKEFETEVNFFLNKAAELSEDRRRKSLSKQDMIVFVLIVASRSKGTIHHKWSPVLDNEILMTKGFPTALIIVDVSFPQILFFDLNEMYCRAY